MKNVVLIGMSGVGKSTVGVLLAKRLGYGFVDTDLLLSEKYAESVSDLLKEKGYDEFLKIEGRVGENSEFKRTVVATGGSMVLSEAAMSNLKKNAIVIWLDADKDEIERRISSTIEDRGVAMPYSMSVSELCEYRRKYYEKYCDVHIKCINGDLQATVDLIFDTLKKFAEFENV